MKLISLLLATPEGDELGRLQLGDVAVADAGETGGALRPRLEDEMAQLDERIRSAIEQEGMALAINQTDFRIVVSRALLGGEDPEQVLIRLPVREAAKPADETDPPSADRPPRDSSSVLDGLFDLDSLSDGEATHA
jgi:hypothetical protein